MKETLVLYPTAGAGHMAPMVALAKLLDRHGFSVIIVVIETPSDTSAASLISRVSSAHPSISFHRLPLVSLPPPSPTLNPLVSFFDLLRLNNPHLLHFLRSHSQTSSSPIRALILDMFCTDALDIAAELQLPSYIFFTTSASNLSTFLLFPTLHSQTTASFKDLGQTPLHFPGLPPIPASDMPPPMLDRNDEAYKRLLFHFERLPRSKGIIVNTFEALEKPAVGAVVDGLSLPGRPMPPIYCIGPLIGDGSGEEGEKHECLTWLDTQPRASVVFLSFGSMGSFSAEQLKEIATGLERSGQRFLWVVRSPPVEDPAKRSAPKPEPDLDALLPVGFLHRTEGRGLVVKSWAPQVAVLSHESVGAFVTHCGWNSVLETICSGVAMIAWPLYSEQRMNKVCLVEKKLAVEMKGYDKGLVSAEEVETRIRWVMESEGGRELRDRAVATKDSAIAALREGGSSHAAAMELVSLLRGSGAASGVVDE